MAKQRTRLENSILDFVGRYRGDDKKHRPMEFIIELAVRSLTGTDSGEAATERLKVLIADAVGGKLVGQLSAWANWRHTWDEADLIAAPALELYLRLEDDLFSMQTRGPSWWERDAATLEYLVPLYWSMPDRDLDTGEEKTNCTTYLIDRPCMLRTKEVLFSWFIGRWRLDAFPEKELGSKNAHAAFAFIKEVFMQNASCRETTPRNLAKLREVESFPSKWRVFHDDEKKLLLKLLKRHLEREHLEDIRPWVSDDLPDEILKLFQETLIRTGDRATVLRLLKGAETAA